MALIYNNAFRPFFDFPFDGALASRAQLNSRAFRPAIDLKESEDKFTITAELAGLSKDDINIEVKEGTLILSGEKHEEKKEENERWHKVERRTGKFERRFVLPHGVQPDDLHAEYKDGVLVVVVKKPAPSVARSIPINDTTAVEATPVEEKEPVVVSEPTEAA